MNKYKIYRNKRVEANNFTMKHQCDFCDRFSSQILAIHTKFKKLEDCQFSHNICKTCLSEMIKILDENQINNLQSDFDNR